MEAIKLGNIFEGNVFLLTQSPHGKFQNLKAVDGRHPKKSNKNLVAPTAGTVGSVLGSGQQRYFYFSCHRWKIQFVHAKPVKKGFVRKGQKIGEIVPYKDKQGNRADHAHIAINVGGKWKTIFDYMNHEVKIKCNPALPWKSKKWEKWSTWNDRELASCEHPKTSDPCKKYKDALIEVEEELKASQNEIRTFQVQDTLKSEKVAELKQGLSKCEQVRNTQKKQWDKDREELVKRKKCLLSNLIFNLLRKKDGKVHGEDG